MYDAYTEVAHFIEWLNSTILQHGSMESCGYNLVGSEALHTGGSSGASWVSCGSHSTQSCAECPQGNGASWCNGECFWEDGQCKLQQEFVVSCGSHNSQSCAGCGPDASWCNGDCYWQDDQCKLKMVSCGNHESQSCAGCGSVASLCNGDCFWGEDKCTALPCYKINSRYNPIDDISGEGRTEEESAWACQARCATVATCSFFSFWSLSGGCHLSSEAAVIEETPQTVTAGPRTCSGFKDACYVETWPDMEKVCGNCKVSKILNYNKFNI